MPKLTQQEVEIPDSLKPYNFHGIDLTYKPNSKEAIGDCPFCGKEGKFSIKVATGQWRCLSCNEGEEKDGKFIRGGNASTFIRKLWEHSDKQTNEYSQLADSRGFLYPETLVEWNICKSIITGDWLVPGWSWSDGEKNAKLVSLYRYIRTPKRSNLFGTPTLGAKLFGLNLYDPNKGTVYLCESIWDALAVYEVLKRCKSSEGKLIPTTNEAASLWADSSILATPGCNTFFDSWCKYFSGKNVIILTQNDHPKPHPKTGEMQEPASYYYALRTIRMLGESDNPPESIKMILWEPEGYDKDLPSGYDARDILKEHSEIKDRITAFSKLLEKLDDRSHIKEEVATKKAGKNELQSTHCDTYRELVTAWKKGMKWTDGLDYALSVMLATIASTKLLGDQLWFLIISPPSTGKSTLCEALSANKSYVVAKSTFSGFHSGYKSDEEGEEDNSLIPHINGKTLVIKDADSLLTSGYKEKILGEARDLYDGTSRNHYGNQIQREYLGIRTTLLLCGTAALREMDSSELGARFLCCTIMNRIDEDLEHEVGWRVVNRADLMMAFESDGQLDTHQSPEMTTIMRLTSGYVTYLRENVVELMSQIDTTDKAKEFCVHLGKFVSYMRARPSKRQDEQVEREFSARLISQLYRASKCLAVVMNKNTMEDAEVEERIRKVALDTSQGQTYDFTRLLYEAGRIGHDSRWLANATSRSIEKVNVMLRFLKHIGVVESFQVKMKGLKGTKVKYRLTDNLYSLFEEVHQQHG